MLFSGLFFLYVFMPALLIAYFVIPSNAWRRGVLIAFSLFFYAWGEPIYVLLMVFSVLCNYLFGLWIDREHARNKSGTVQLVLALILNFGMLGVFKYAGFAVETLNLIPGLALPVPQIALPLGISFFTFQAVSYVIDVKRGSVTVQKSFWRLLLYISFFPQLVAGPIVQYSDIESQLENRRANIEEICDGAFRFCVGLGKKVLIANACGSVADTLLLTKADGQSVLGMWMGALFFAMQIYFDFGGYSDMAIGLGRIFGFHFRENFDYPYISRSATEFWRRWHISLGTFFREYVYIPLGGNRGHWVRNVMIVWFLTGLWHGASWNFIAWGLYYGLLLLFEKKLLFPLYRKIGALPSTIFAYLYMIVVTLVGWTIFYYEDGFLSHVGMLFGAGGIPFTDVFALSTIRSHLYLLIIAVLLSTPLFAKIGEEIQNGIYEPQLRYCTVRVFKTVCSLALLAASTVMLAGNTYNAFLYFRF